MIKVYSKRGCSSCVLVKNHLKKNGIEFEEIDLEEIDNSEEVISKAQSFGVMRMPIVVKDDHYCDMMEVLKWK